MFRRVLQLAAALCLPGCFPTVDVGPTGRCATIDGAGDVTPPDVLVAGEQASFTLAVKSPGCLPPDAWALAEVDAPNGRRVPAEVTFEPVGNVARVTVTFTPPVAGAYQVAAWVEPSVGVARLAMGVARVAPVSLIGRVEVPCAQEALTAQGAWVCLAGTRVTVWRDGMQLQALPATGLAVSGDSLWLFAPGQVERFVDLGGSFLVREPDVALAFDAPGAALARASDELWTVTDAAVTRWRLDGTGLQQVGVRSIPAGLCEDAPGFALAQDVPILTLACTSRPGAARLCGFPVPKSQGACRELPGARVGLEAGAVWLAEGDGLHRVGLSGQALSLRVPGATFTATSGGWPVVTTASGRALLPVVGVNELGLETIATTLPLLSATRDAVIAGGPTARVAFRRAP